MTALAPSKPAPYQAVQFEAFRVSGGQTARLSLGAVATLDEAVRSAAPACLFKEQLVIRERDEETGGTRLHIFTIRRKAPTWLTLPGEHLPTRTQQQFADLVCSVDEGVLS